MVDVRLINPAPNGVYNFLEQREREKVELAEPLGILYLASYLRSQGISVDILDLNILNRVAGKLTGIDDVVSLCIEDSPKLIGMPTYTLMMPEIIELSKRIKGASDIKIVHGGPHATFLDESSLRNGFADFIIRKEGEISLLELTKYILQGGNKSDIKGISYFENGVLIRNPDRERIIELDNLPFPARDLVSQDYFTQSRLNMITSRGCPERCIYCVSPNYWDRRVTFRSVKNIETEMAQFFSAYTKLSDTFYINFVDDTFTLGGEKRNKQMAEMLSQFGYEWHIFSRVDTVTPGVLDLFHKSNCKIIRFGIEAGTDRMLELFGKNQTLDKVKHTIEASKSAGLITQGSFMICSPTETEKEVNSTIDFACSLPLDYAFFFITTPYPGTSLMNDYVPKNNQNDFSNMDKFIHNVSLYGNNERISPERKAELLERAYAKFYLEKKGMALPKEYYATENLMRRVGLLQQTIMKEYYGRNRLF